MGPWCVLSHPPDAWAFVWVTRTGGAKELAKLRRGFTLVELLIVMAIMGLLAALAMPSLNEAVEQARVARAIGDIKAMGIEISQFELTEGRFPTTLAEVGRITLIDPWGNPYVYKQVTGPGGARKDKFQVPVNDDFDLYSMGRDGKTTGPLTAKVSRDDVVRANSGGFVGLASNY